MKQNWWKLLIVVLVAVAVVAAVALKDNEAGSEPPVSVAKTETATSSETKPTASAGTDVVEAEKPNVEESKPEDAGTVKPQTATTKPSTSTPAKPAAKPKPPKLQPKQLPRMLDLGAEKCTPCKMMKPVMAELRQEYAGKLEIEFIDVWKNAWATEKYGIDTIPTQIFYDENGKEFSRHVGYFPKDEIVATFRGHGIDL